MSLASSAPRPKDSHDPYAPLRIANFRWFVISILTMAMSAQIQGVVVAWQMYAVTHDPLALGLVGLAEAAPFVSFALYAGHVADVRDRRRVALTALVVLLICAGLLAVASAVFFAPTSTSALAGHARPGALIQAIIYGIIVVCGAARSFLLPARNALGADLVPRALFPSAVAWRAGIWQVAAVAGPALGGIFYTWVGPTRSYAISAALMAVSLFTVAKIRAPARPPSAVSDAPLIASVREGLAFLFKRPIFMGAITLDLVAVLFGGAVAILPIFADQILFVGPTGLGALRAAPAIGAVLMSGFIALRPPGRNIGRTFMRAVVAFGAFTIGFALSRSFVLSLALLAAAGAADMLSVYFRATLMQVMVPSGMLGRVSAVNQIFIGSSNELGAFESGVAARLLGTVPSVVMGGAITVVSALTTNWVFPSLARLDSFADYAHAPESTAVAATVPAAVASDAPITRDPPSAQS
ncbi:MAG TPA: MFS transporter [Polyangia bacterium]|jgi:MFS family permease|nr:MFS transporter [Polyangia bacterium]